MYADVTSDACFLETACWAHVRVAITLDAYAYPAVIWGVCSYVIGISRVRMLAPATTSTETCAQETFLVISVVCGCSFHHLCTWGVQSSPCGHVRSLPPLLLRGTSPLPLDRSLPCCMSPGIPSMGVGSNLPLGGRCWIGTLHGEELPSADGAITRILQERFSELFLSFLKFSVLEKMEKSWRKNEKNLKKKWRKNSPDLENSGKLKKIFGKVQENLEKR